MSHHNLKLFTKYFEPLKEGQKTCETRYNDRGFEKWDTVTFHEGEPDKDVEGGFRYTGRKISARISHLQDFGCQPGYVTLSLVNIDMLVVDEEDGLSPQY